MNKISSFFRIDERVFFTMGGVFLAALLVLAFRSVTRHNCGPVKIITTAGSFMTDNQIVFKADVQSGKYFSWNFGDGATADEETFSSSHVYKKAGRYTVSVLVDGQCSEYQTIAIAETPKIINLSSQPLFLSPVRAYVNESVTFEDTSSNAKTWDWSFEEPAGSVATGRKVTHIFIYPGNKLVTLKVNGRPDLVISRSVVIEEKQAKPGGDNSKSKDRQRKEKVIYVKDEPSVPAITVPVEPVPKPVEPAPPPPKRGAEATPAQLEAMLMEVNAGTKTADDFAKYFCDNPSVHVIYNDSPMSFVSMCEKIKGMKKRRIKKISVFPIRNANNCILSMTVVLDRTLL